MKKWISRHVHLKTVKLRSSDHVLIKWPFTKYVGSHPKPINCKTVLKYKYEWLRIL